MIVGSSTPVRHVEDSSMDTSVTNALWDKFKMNAFKSKIIILDIKGGTRPELKIEEVQKLFRVKMGLLGPHFTKELDEEENPDRIYRCYCTKQNPTGNEIREALASFFEESKDRLRILDRIRTKVLAPEASLSDWGVEGDGSHTIFVHKFGSGA